MCRAFYWKLIWLFHDKSTVSIWTRDLNYLFDPYKTRVTMFQSTGINDMMIIKMNIWGNVSKSGKILSRYIHVFAARQDELLRSTTDPDVREDIKNHPVRISFAAFGHSSLFVSTRVPATEVQSSVIAASIHGYIVSHKNLSSGTNPSSQQQVHMKFRTHKVNVLSLVLVCKLPLYVNKFNKLNRAK